MQPIGQQLASRIQPFRATFSSLDSDFRTHQPSHIGEPIGTSIRTKPMASRASRELVNAACLPIATLPIAITTVNIITQTISEFVPAVSRRSCGPTSCGLPLLRFLLSLSKVSAVQCPKLPSASFWSLLCLSLCLVNQTKLACRPTRGPRINWLGCPPLSSLLTNARIRAKRDHRQ